MDQEEIKVYVATENGYHGWGCEVYLLGVFDSKEKAEATGGDVEEVILNKTYPLSKKNSMESYNDHYLGGYIE